MKFSQFNSIIPYREHFALFNSFNQKVIFLLPKLKELLENSLVEGIDNLKKKHPSFYDYLIEQEFIIEEIKDELSTLKEISKRIDNDSETFILTINPTMNCNFKCWYCYETQIENSKLENDVIDKIKKCINNILKNNSGLKTFSISFFGGEPLLYFEETIIPIIDFAQNLCYQNGIIMNIGFTTNGFLINKKISDYLNNTNLSCFMQITLDGYKDSHDSVRYTNKNKGTYAKIVKNIRLLITNNICVRVRINYTNKNIEDVYRIADDFIDVDQKIKDKYLFFDFHRVWQNANEGNISSMLNENIKTIRNKGFIVKNNNLNNVFESCYADKRNSVVINYNGDIYKCTARDFTKNNRVGYIDDFGDLIWCNNHLEKRMNIKFKNKSCFSCKLLPICNGGCSQHALENFGNDYCIIKENEIEKINIISNKIEEIIFYEKTKDLTY